MGNHQSEPNQRIHLAEIRQTHRRGGFIMHKRQKMGELKNRRQSMPVERLVMDNKHGNFTSFAYGDKEEVIQCRLAPRIQINGEDSSQPSSPSDQKHPSSHNHQLRNSIPFSVSQSCSGIPEEAAEDPMHCISPLVTGVAQEAPEASPSKKHRFVRNPKSAAARRTEFLSFTNNFIVRSLDETANVQDFDIDMKPLSHRARSLSPLKQLRTYSLGRRFPSDENVLTPEHCLLIRQSWKSVSEMITTGSCHRSFGFLVLKRVLDKMPSLKPVFKLNEFESLNDIPKEHSFIRHTGLFQSIIELAIRNIDELESEIAPVLFAYGRRHYEHDLHGIFNEESVRLFCGQVVCTVLDVLGNEISTDCMEAWIELMRYLGRALLNGYEYESLNRKNKFALKTSERAFFIS